MGPPLKSRFPWIIPGPLQKPRDSDEPLFHRYPLLH